MTASPQWPSAPERRLLAALAGKPLTEIVGVVHPLGPGAVRSQGQATWTFTVTLEPWRVAGGALHGKAILLRREVDDGELERLRGTIEGYQILRFRVRMGTDPARNSLVGVIDEFLGRVEDAELEAAAAELRKPVEHADEVLGVFVLDRRLDTFEGSCDWNGVRVQISIKATEAKEIRAALRVARAICGDASGVDGRARAFAAAELLETYNDGWNEDEDGNATRELSATEFCVRLIPESLTIHSDGGWSIWYDDGNLFGGHAIEVVADKRGKFDEAHLAG